MPDLARGGAHISAPDRRVLTTSSPSEGTAYRLQVKLPCESLEMVLASGIRLRCLRPLVFEDTSIYSFEGARLGENIRLRAVTPIDGASRTVRATLVYKGPSHCLQEDATRRRSRERIKIAVGHPNKLAQILKRLGLRRVFCYQRYRTVYFGALRDGRTVLAKYDETPIGSFLKLDGPSDVVDGVARILGFRPEHFLRTSYVELQRAYCAARGKPFGDALFSASARRGHVGLRR
jgi:adenylate cyclase class IV